MESLMRPDSSTAYKVMCHGVCGISLGSLSIVGTSCPVLTGLSFTPLSVA